MTTTCSASHPAVCGPPRRWRLGDVLAETEASTPGRTALIVGADRRHISYRELSAAAGDLAAALRRRGLRRGNVVGLQTATSVHFVVALLAAARLGLIVAPHDPTLPGIEKHRRADLLGARATLVEGNVDDDGDCPDWPIVEGRLGLPTEVDAAMRPRTVESPPALTSADALIMATSGTSGSPKFVPWTHHNLAASLTSTASSYALSYSDSTVAVMPLFHGHGLVAGLLATLATGGSVLLPGAGRFSAHTFWDDVDAAEATWFTAVPTMLRILLDRAAVAGPDHCRNFGTLRFIRSCSAPLRADTITELESTFHAPVLGAYGMTETTHQAATVRPGDGDDTRLHTVGGPTGLTARIHRADGAETPAGAAGEIWLRGPTVTRGYLPVTPDARSQNALTFDGSWLRTGDLGVLDTAGRLIVTGRIKNLINRGGEKISPEHVEQVLAADPRIGEVAVVGIPDSTFGEQVAVAVVPSADTLTAEEITAYCRSRLTRHETPEVIEIVHQLPLTAKGDIDRVRLRALLSPTTDR
ncbi:Acyl-CoA synthetase (AMP-forming)/AMP-acid ligase II [Mycolicibacterium rutilum]|uniref:Acyl-CoA synthetase (AMP-forming)/AMP-acid ligase II n=1 Tax=Mycolicibacterium rutilum TaxID=370526 RepID=A0A1H6J2Q1_MYCRU|nr:AMP-binding protein [Mycolicibacterium rutilum]SEH54488.1 Acyl-CoA synthetase (AMP-forming)/AMP-acid ligase II [Mycolicibacterium rutilum]